jgi:hypothetical protein
MIEHFPCILRWHWKMASIKLKARDDGNSRRQVCNFPGVSGVPVERKESSTAFPDPQLVTYTGLARPVLAVPSSPLPASTHTSPRQYLSLPKPQICLWLPSHRRRPERPKARVPCALRVVVTRAGCVSVPLSILYTYSSPPQSVEFVARNATKSPTRTTIVRLVSVSVSNALASAPSVLSGSGWVPLCAVLLLSITDTLIPGQPQRPCRPRQDQKPSSCARHDQRSLWRRPPKRRARTTSPSST